jgi:hypothetical protein
MNNDPYNQANTALATRTFSLDQIIAIWLHEKANRTGSAETERCQLQAVATVPDSGRCFQGCASF